MYVRLEPNHEPREFQVTAVFKHNALTLAVWTAIQRTLNNGAEG